MTATGTGQRLLTLDLLRGVAALLVVLYHLDQRFGGAARVPGGYLAVDFFFLLSGYVIAAAYGERLRRGLALRRFAVLRLVRLYPLYLAGLVVGVAALAWQPASELRRLDGPSAAVSLTLNAALLPALFTHQLFPMNFPAWSLLCELAINLLFAARLFRSSTRHLWLLICVGAVMLCAGGWWLGRLDGGVDRATSWFGLVRCFFSFVLGVALLRLEPSRRRAPSWAGTLVPVAALVGVMLVPATPGSSSRLPLDLLGVLLVFPALLVGAARYDPPRKLVRVSALAGDLSFAIYALHAPLIAIVSAAVPGAHARVIALGVTILAALGAARWYDAPVRAWLSRRLRTRESAPPQLVA